MINPIRFTWCLIFSASFHLAIGQDWKNIDLDELFQKARTEAFAGSREDSRKMLQFILEKNPNYEDARILLARTYAWDENRNIARIELKKVLATNAKSKDGLNALVDIEMWDGKYDAALQVVEGALEAYPSFEDFLFKKASILNELQKPIEAKSTLAMLLRIDPTNQKALTLLSYIELGEKKNAIGGSYSVDLFSQTFNPAHYGSIQVSRQNRWGSAIVRLNYANRFNTNGLQSEIDLYPKITDGVYVYLNYGYSGSSIFPMNRAGAELFSRLPKGMEISAGARYMNVRSTSNIFIYTGSFGIYFKNCWVSFRPYIIPDRIARTTYSASVSFKKFWQNPDNYLGLNIGGGFSPDERRFQSGKGFTTDNIYILQSQRASITLQRAIRPTLLIIASAEAIRQELVFDTGSYMYIISTSVGIRKKF